MKGGSRCGAGRPAWHAKTSSVHRVDIGKLHRAGHLEGSRSLTWTWENKANINLTTSSSEVTFQYNYRESVGEWKPVNQRVSLAYTPCHYGGSRPWFVCPRCYRHVAILYIHGWPACRKCKRLVYPVQSMDAMARNWHRLHRIENKLSGGERDWNYRRPKGMRTATFDRLRDEYFHLEDQNELILCQFMGRFGLKW